MNRDVEPGPLAPGYLNLVDEVVVHVHVSKQRNVIGNSRGACPSDEAADTERSAIVRYRSVVTIIETARIRAGTDEKVICALILLVIRNHDGETQSVRVALPGAVHRSGRGRVPAQLVNIGAH